MLINTLIRVVGCKINSEEKEEEEEGEGEGEEQPSCRQMTNWLRRKSGKQHLSQVASNNTKYLGMVLGKQVKDFYDKTFKTLEKKIEDIWRWKDLPWTWMGRINRIQMATLLKAIFRFTSIPVKILRHFLQILEGQFFSFVWMHKKLTRITKTILKIHFTLLEVTLLDIKLYYRPIVIETVWH